jgi:hypothetical protein
MARYSQMESLLVPPEFMVLITTPTHARNQIIPNNDQPQAPGKTINVNGVYVPAISRKIAL